MCLYFACSFLGIPVDYYFPFFKRLYVARAHTRTLTKCKQFAIICLIISLNAIICYISMAYRKFYIFDIFYSSKLVIFRAEIMKSAHTYSDTDKQLTFLSIVQSHIPTINSWIRSEKNETPCWYESLCSFFSIVKYSLNVIYFTKNESWNRWNFVAKSIFVFITILRCAQKCIHIFDTQKYLNGLIMIFDFGRRRCWLEKFEMFMHECIITHGMDAKSIQFIYIYMYILKWMAYVCAPISFTISNKHRQVRFENFKLTLLRCYMFH